MPESPRWLLATGRFKKAIVVLKKIAKHNGTKLNDEHLMQLKVRSYKTISLGISPQTN